MILRILLTLMFLSVDYIPNNPKKRVVFSEDFEEPFLDINYWNYELGDGCPELCGWGNKELQHYTKSNIFIRNKNLVIKATRENNKFFSGRITTKDKVEFQYGTVEVRAKLPTGTGMWPAIWMLGHDIDENYWPSCGEIDIMEYVGKNPGEIHTTLHTTDSYGKSKNTKITNLDNIEQGFHVYTMHWDKDQIQFTIDNNIVYTFSPDNKNDSVWPFDKPFYLILNLAIGGHFGGFEVDNNVFPQEFIIDYIKVYDDTKD